MHGVKFDNIHSYTDLGLILSQKTLTPAPVKSNYVDVPGADGSLDYTEATGAVRFGDREFSFLFTVLPTDDFEAKKTLVSNLLNGKRCNIILDKDPTYYWSGRVFVNEYTTEKKINQIGMGAIVRPYKLKVAPTIITVSAGTNKAVTLKNGRKTVIPQIVTTAATKIVVGTTTINLNAGTHYNSNIRLVYGDNPMTITSTASVKFTYQEGDL